jgi:DNA-binding CsgD family transcriptional regulator
MTLDVLDVIEAAYRLDVDDATWLDAVLHAARPGLDGGLGLTGYFVDVGQGGFRAWGHTCVGRDVSAERTNFERWSRSTPTALKRHSHLARPAGLVTEIPPPSAARSLEPLLVASGFEQVFGVAALDESGVGCAISAPRSRSAPVPESALWARVSMHLASAGRLRRRLASGAVRPEAILDPDGTIVDAGAAATRSKATLEALRTAVLRIDGARTRRGRRDPRTATQVWTALAAGRWSLVDQFDRDGRRYYVAWPNELEESATLTEREAQVVASCGRGNSNKLIAYELGLSESTVARTLSRAARKLGASSRVELVRRAMERVGPRR